MFTHRLLFRTASAAVRKQQWLGAQSSVMGCKSKRMEFHTTAPTSVKAFPEVETDKKITHTPTTVAEREMIRKTEKNAHSDMDKMRPPKTEQLKNNSGDEPPPKDPSTRERSTAYIKNSGDDLEK